MTLKKYFAFLHKTISIQKYFTLVGLLTIFILIAFIGSRPVLMQKIKSALWITKPLIPHDNSFYIERVQPILDKYCTTCHDDSKAKGKLRLDSFLYTRFSGKSSLGVIPNHANESYIIQRMLLNENDKRLMPPLGWEHPTKDEKEILKQWIDNNASHTLTSADFPNAPELVIEVVIAEIDKVALNKSRFPTQNLVKEIQQYFPFSLSYIARDRAQLRFTNVSMAGEFTDEQLQKLQPIANHISSLYLRNAKISDHSFDTLSAMSNLTEAYLSGTKLSPQIVINIIDKLPKIKRLTIDSSAINTELREICKKRNIELAEVNRG